LRPYSVLLSCFRSQPLYTLILAGGCSPDFLRHSISLHSLESDPNLETQPISWIFVDNTTSFVSYCLCSLNGDNSVMTSFDGRKMPLDAPRRDRAIRAPLMEVLPLFIPPYSWSRSPYGWETVNSWHDDGCPPVPRPSAVLLKSGSAL